MGLATDPTIISGAAYEAHSRRLALYPFHLPYLRERSSCSPSVPGDCRSEGQSAGGKVQLGTFAASEPARDACSEDSRGFAEGGRRVGQVQSRRLKAEDIELAWFHG